MFQVMTLPTYRNYPVNMERVSVRSAERVIEDYKNFTELVLITVELSNLRIRSDFYTYIQDKKKILKHLQLLMPKVLWKNKQFQHFNHHHIQRFVK